LYFDGPVATELSAFRAGVPPVFTWSCLRRRRLNVVSQPSWGAYLLGIDQESGDLFLLQLNTGTTWPIEAVAKNWVATTATFWAQLKQTSRRRRQRRVRDQRLGDWLTLTRSIAADFEHSPNHRDAMIALADAVEADQCQERDLEPKRADHSPRRVLETQFNAMLWAAAELRNAATAAGLPWNGADWHRALFRDEREYGEGQKVAFAARVRRFDRKITSNRREPLVAEVLEAILSHGPFLSSTTLLDP
jgi:hypothetical protein